MTLTCEETMALVCDVLKWDIKDLRHRLHLRLLFMNRTEAEFYAGIVEHCPGHLNSDQWFELLSRIPVWLLRSQLDLRAILSESQRNRLPPITG